MSDQARFFLEHLMDLRERDRGALAHLKRSLGFDPGAYPRAYPYVERFVGADSHADDPRRKALYLTAGLFAWHPLHQGGQSLATALGRVGHSRGSGSIEQRFIALLEAEPDDLPTLLRQIVSLLSADAQPCDYVKLLEDLSRWLDIWGQDTRDHLRQRWARDFYRAYEPYQAAETSADTLSPAN